MDSNEQFEIVDLEYDVGGVGAEEPADSQVNQAAWLVTVTPFMTGTE